MRKAMILSDADTAFFTLLDKTEETGFSHSLLAMIQELLEEHLPKEFWQKTLEEKKSFFLQDTPYLSWKERQKSSLEILALCKTRPTSVNFFYEMISRYLLPYHFLSIPVFFSCEIALPFCPEEKWTLLFAKTFLSDAKDFEEVEKNKKAIDIELRLGLSSDYHANRIREFKGLSEDKKTTMIQEKIAALIRTRSKDFGRSIFSHMQHFLVTSSDEFKKKRDYHHLSRLISIFFFMRKILHKKMETAPHQRHLMVKFLKTKIKEEEKEKPVLGILVGLNFLKEHEVFEKEHLFKAIKPYLLPIAIVEDSYLIDRNEKNSMQTLYLEIQREDGADFSYEEIAKLRDLMPVYLGQHIEQLVHPVFMPRNEEEIMRNILSLSHQLRFAHDIPQMILNFEEQKDQHLSFTAIVLRVFRPFSLSLEKILQQNDTRFVFEIDRIKNVGVIKRKFFKEAAVFHVLVPLEDYLRLDNYVDLKKARQDVLLEIQKKLGEVRDFNGGMIAKQDEAFIELKKTFVEKIPKEQELILEKYFYAIRPVSMALTTPKKILQSFFLMLLNAIKREKMRPVKHKDFLFKQETQAVYVIVASQEPKVKTRLDEAIEPLELLSSEIFSYIFYLEGITYVGYVYLCDKTENQKKLILAVQEALDF